MSPSDPQLPKLMLLPAFPGRRAPWRSALDAVLARRGGGDACFAPARSARCSRPAARPRRAISMRRVGRKRRKESGRQRKPAGRQRSRYVEQHRRSVSHRARARRLPRARSRRLERPRRNRRAQPSEIVTFMADGASPRSPAKARRESARLCVDARPIAAIDHAAQRRIAWCWKIAYDEGFARFSPGVQLLLDVTQTLLDDSAIARADSCATADHPMIDHVWRERLALADRCCSAGREPRSALRWLAGSNPCAAPRSAAPRRCGTGCGGGKSRLLPQQPPDHLAGRGHRHLLDEGDLARIFVRGQPGLDEAPGSRRRAHRTARSPT